ncbi:hypothetical protein K503DRAFT_78624 [Rhizopogon vinicolor AM-OR11-026]|uniref:Uncharacterized protein n=1 Tax=Rhizopogon vinicolor AM-OR11-026 TaxID=1314800 RepID=A0A1B7N3W4_9AGAM|nr:hypothetical protein K503DRAFT_78624 [Rhizopogon vinicolor AM-OR11-026]
MNKSSSWMPQKVRDTACGGGDYLSLLTFTGTTVGLVLHPMLLFRPLQCYGLLGVWDALNANHHRSGQSRLKNTLRTRRGPNLNVKRAPTT